MKKQILIFTIITILPFGAMADDPHIGPTGNVIPTMENGQITSIPNTVSVATDGPFYTGAQITNADKQHIASTAYVKGAYNDLVAVDNKIAMLFDNSIREVKRRVREDVDEAVQYVDRKLNIYSQWGTDTVTPALEVEPN